MPGAESVRRSAVAGSWYPGTEPALRRTVTAMLAQVQSPPAPGRLLGLISPHAGYAYSGQTAAHAFRQLDGLRFDTVVVLAPSHRSWLPDPGVSAESAYETPLGEVSIDHEFIAALGTQMRLQRIRGDGEHAVEIQLPFLQVQLGAFKLVPILVSADDSRVAREIAHALAVAVRGSHGSTLLVASSDMHHIENYDEVVRRDRPVVDAVAAYDMDELERRLMAPRCSVCGRIPILAVMHACRELGADSSAVLHSTTSGDVTGQRAAGQYTVGYLAAALYRAA